MSWQSIAFGECIELVSGAAFKSTMFTDNPDDIPLVKGENIGQGEILWDKSRYWPAAQFEEYSKLALVADDIVLAMDRPWVTAGLKFAIISERDPASLLVQRVARIRPKPNANAKFLKHIIGSRAFLEYIKGIMGGTNVPHISGGQIRDFRCQLPDLVTQQRIAATLSAYDDLIENNRRRIGLLEEAARQLYKEWFVRFRFPGHENIKIIEGVPEGWDRLKLGDVLTLQRGFDLPNGDRLAGTVPVYGSTGIVGYHAKAKVDAPMIITGRSGSLGQVCFVAVPSWPLNTSLWVREFKRVSPWYAYFLLSEIGLEKFNGGASVPTLDRKVAHAADVKLPTESLMGSFDETAKTSFAMIENLKSQNVELAKARDLLLPRLMSGSLAA